MAILVTGGAGYIGGVTVEYLLAQDENVVVVDNLSRGHRSALDPAVPFYDGNVGDSALLERIIRENEIESCIHFAALAYVGESVKEPQLYFENNVTQGLAFLAALIRAGVRRVVFSSSCVTYGEPEAVPIKEDTRQWPTSPYGWSKLLLERALASYDTAYGLKFVALRYFNAAGATETRGEDHDPETHLIPSVLQAACGKRGEISIFGNHYPTPDGTAIRDYIHVIDLAEAHCTALNYLRNGGGSEFLNLGSGRGYSVLDVVARARQVTGRPIRAVIGPPRPGDPSQLVADVSKAEKVLGWTARHSDLARILQDAWQWQVRRLRGYAAG